jgi:nucleotide-binding universal stress UspA family protein
MFRQLLLALDDSPSAPVGVSFATTQARRDAASVHVVHVNRFLLGGRGFTMLTEAEAADLVDRAVDELRTSGVRATGSVMRGTCFDVPTRILESAQAWSAGVIVLGSRRHRRLRPGRGVRQAVIKRALIPVMSAPAPLEVPSRHTCWPD